MHFVVIDLEHPITHLEKLACCVLSSVVVLVGYIWVTSHTTHETCCLK